MNPKPRFRFLVLAALVTAGVLGLGWVAWQTTPSVRGSLMAKMDIKMGKRELMSYGLISVNSLYYQRIMEQKFHVQVRFVAGCIVRTPDRRFWEAYNNTMSAKIIEEQGPNVFKACNEEVDRQMHRDGYLH